ncbi:MAG: 30S ribosomal protein S16 [Phycisphaerae bacterium]
MAVKLRLKRLGRIHRPFYRLNAIDERRARDSKVIEELGWYNPVAKAEGEKDLELNLERCRYWLDTGAIPSDTASSLMKRAGLEHKRLRLPKPRPPKKVPEAKAK